MAHQTEIVVNGQTVEVTEFDHTAQEIDDGINKVNTLTGEGIPTSASDPTTISSQLSNAAWNSYGFLQNVDIIEWAKSQTKGGSFLAFPNCTSLPENDLYFAGTLFVNAKGDTWSISAICVTTGITYTNASSSAGSVWTGWQPIATATPPQEFNLPLAEGVSAVSSAYWKDQFGVVTGHFNVLVSSSQTGSSPVIATLPEGFRPSRQANATAVVSSGESLGLLVLVTGEIQLQDAASVTLEGKYIKGLFSFVAAT